jgi:hypothetical protein
MIQHLHQQYGTFTWQVFNDKYEQHSLNKQMFLLEKSLKRQLKKSMPGLDKV